MNYYDSLHAAGICLGPIQARTHVQRALACQLTMIFAQRKLRLTMQHVYGHSGNLGNECADHAAALGTLDLTSNHNVATRWIHRNFDASACFEGCNNITEILERLQRIRTDAVVLLTCISGCFVYSCSQPFPFGLLFPRTSDGQSFFIRLCCTEF